MIKTHRVAWFLKQFHQIHKRSREVAVNYANCPLLIDTKSVSNSRSILAGVFVNLSMQLAV